MVQSVRGSESGGHTHICGKDWGVSQEERKIAVETRREGGMNQKFNLAGENSPHCVKRKSARKYSPECYPKEGTVWPSWP